ncbi:MAG: YraN family protein [Candidatus Onthomonas sp.]
MDRRTDPDLGRWGEALAARWLYDRGYQILASRVCFREGELDLVARKGDVLAVVEVKLRTGNFAPGAQAVTLRKQGRIRQALGRYLELNPELADCYIRFDVCQIDAPQGVQTREPVLSWFENAFY